ncbi:MAG: T9SS type A sorting domain-containing protein [Gemmatimonadetes bacterium]|nr:T9SS type A sorting domain-containing protein [Gemmatimonadota bacterium]
MATRIVGFALLLVALAVPGSASAWESMGPEGGEVDGFAQSIANPNRLYLLEPWAGLLRSDDHGASWFRPQPGFPPGLRGEVIVVSPGDPEVVLIAEQGNDGLWRSTDQGAGWERTTVGEVRSLAFDPFDDSVVLACVVTPAPGVYRSPDAGATWTLLDAAIGTPQQVAWNPEVPGAVLVGAAPSIFRSSDGGETWESADLAGESSNGLLAFGGGSPPDAWSMSPDGFLLFSADGGASFESRGHPPGCVIDPDNYIRCFGHRIAGDPTVAGHVTVGYSAGHWWDRTLRIARSTDRGLTWSPPWIPTALSAQATGLAHDRAAGDVIFLSARAGSRLGLARSTDRGDSWDGWMNGIHRVSLSAIRADNHGQLWARGRFSDGLWKSTDAGESWEDLSDTTPITMDFGQFYASRLAPDLLFETGAGFSTDTAEPLVRRSTDGGLTWRWGAVEFDWEHGWTVLPGAFAISGDGRTAYLWCSGSPSHLTRADTDPENPDDPPIFRIIQDGFLAADAYVESAGTVWAINADLPGDVQLSTDFGVTWSPRDEGLPADHGIALLPRPTTSDSGADVSLVTVHRTAGAHRTTDAGRTWDPIALPGYSGETVIAADQDVDGDRLFLATSTSVYVQGQGFVSSGLGGGILVRSLTYETESRNLFVATNTGVFRLTPGSVVWAPVGETASRFSLHATPNPARGTATIHFTLPSTSLTRLDVFDVAGRRVASLVDEPLAAGPHQVRWGDDVAAGVYFVQIRQDSETEVRRIVRID